MKTMFTALTRPRIASGVASCTSADRTKTLTMSEAPMSTRATSDTAKLRDRPNAIVAAPKTATQANILAPAAFSMGRSASPNAVTAAPGSGRASQHAERPRPEVQDVAGIDGQERGRAAEEHCEEVERDGAEDDRVAPHVAHAGEQ